MHLQFSFTLILLNKVYEHFVLKLSEKDYYSRRGYKSCVCFKLVMLYYVNSLKRRIF